MATAGTKKYSGQRTAKQIKKVISKRRQAVADGDMLPLKKRLLLVMLDEELRIRDIIPKLEEKGWLPDCQDPSTYLSMVLSTETKDFKRVARGTYKAKPQRK